MAKKVNTIRSQYEDIVARYGVKMDDCRILAFRFADYEGSVRFHYLLMTARVQYFVFDATEDRAQVVISDDERIAKTVERAAQMVGGVRDAVLG